MSDSLYSFVDRMQAWSRPTSAASRPISAASRAPSMTESAKSMIGRMLEHALEMGVSEMLGFNYKFSSHVYTTATL